MLDDTDETRTMTTMTTMMMKRLILVLIALLVSGTTEGFTVVKSPVAVFSAERRHPHFSSSSIIKLRASAEETSSSTTTSESSSSPSVKNKFSKATSGLRRARDLVLSLVQDEKCYTTEAGAAAFAQVCAANVIIEDCFFPQPFNGKMEATRYMLQRVEQRKSKNGQAAVNNDAAIRIDRITDGDTACGFVWTWTCGPEEGLRGTTFVQLNNAGEIAYMQEIPEPIWKPGNFTKDLLKAILKNAKPTPPEPFEKKSPTIANELARYIFQDLQYADRALANDEFMRFVDDNIIYRDFNYEAVLRGPSEVRQFVQDFTFPGIEFFPVLFDDGIDSTCFTWEVVLEGSTDTIKGMSFYELDPKTRKIVYIRDVPESAIKPPLLGTWARSLRPGLGVFQGVPIGSRPGGK